MNIQMQRKLIFRNSKLSSSLLFVISFIVAMLLTACGSDDQNGSQNEAAQIVHSVEAVQAKTGSLPLVERLTGVVRAKNQVEIYPQINAVVTEVYVKDGNIVKKGDPLVKLRDVEFQEQLKQAKASHQIALAQQKQAEAQLNRLQLELQRSKTLAEKELISDSELEEIVTRTVSAEADLDLAIARVVQTQASIDEREETLSRTIVRAPVSGSIGNRNAEIGMRVNTNNRLFTMGELGNLEVEVVLTDIMLNYIKTGQRTEIFADIIPGGKIDSKLSRISPFLNPVAHSTEAEIDVKNPEGKLNPGMFVTVDIFYGESEQATLIPLSALYENPQTGNRGVYVSSEKINMELKKGGSADNPISLTDPVQFEFRKVDIIARGRMEAAVKGIEKDEWVITLGQNLLGGETGMARVNPLNWERVEELQNLQSQDILKDIMKKSKEETENSTQNRISN